MACKEKRKTKRLVDVGVHNKVSDYKPESKTSDSRNAHGSFFKDPQNQVNRTCISKPQERIQEV